MQKLKPVHQWSRLADKFIIRLPSGMRDQIAAMAGHNRRSMNSEIILRLQQSFLQSVLLENSDLPVVSSELSSPELILLQRFRQLAPRRQQALVSLIAAPSQSPR